MFPLVRLFHRPIIEFEHPFAGMNVLPSAKLQVQIAVFVGLGPHEGKQLKISQMPREILGTRYNIFVIV